MKTLEGYVSGGDRAQWRGYCPLCKKEHFHGVDDGHRGSHCLDRKASATFYGNGYMIKTITKTDYAALKKHGRLIQQIEAQS